MTPDLAADLGLTLALLDDPHAWRSRAVEQLDIVSARVCHSHRSLQIAPLTELVRPFAGSARSARLFLPLHELPKRPLLDFDVSVDGRPGYLAKRAVISEIEAAHVVALAEREGVEVEEKAEQLIIAICEFTPGVWHTFQRRRLSRRTDIQRYLAMGLRLLDGLQPNVDSEEEDVSTVQRLVYAASGRMVRRFPSLITQVKWVDRPDKRPLELPEGAFEHWSHHATSIGRCLAFALHEGHDDSSSADDPLLALPLLADRGHVGTVEEVTQSLVSLDRAVNALRVAAGGSPPDSLALRTLAGYGRRWQALVWCETPLDRPFIVTSSQELSIEINGGGNLTITPVPFADAVSNHVAVHVRDGNVEMPNVKVIGLDGEHLTHTLATGIRKTREGFAIYTSEAVRDERVQLRLRLRVSRGISLIGVLVQAIAWVAVFVSYYRIHQRTLTAADLAVLVVPSTFAASLLLTRERNSLARRLQIFGRTMTAIATVALWTGVAVAYFNHRLML